MKTYQHQLGDVLKLCMAKDKKEAMQVFETKDVNRVNRYVVNSSLTIDLFRPHETEISAFDGRIILTFPIK